MENEQTSEQLQAILAQEREAIRPQQERIKWLEGLLKTQVKKEGESNVT
jgi:hypothetical protein